MIESLLQLYKRKNVKTFNSEMYLRKSLKFFEFNNRLSDESKKEKKRNKQNTVYKTVAT